MNDEVKEILEDLKNKDLSVDDLTHNDKTKLLDCITNLQKRKITKEDVEKYFEENMCVSFEKFLENWEEQEELTKYLQEENERLNTELNAYKNAVYKVRSYINAYSPYFLQTQEENNQTIAKIIHEELDGGDEE